MILADRIKGLSTGVALAMVVMLAGAASPAKAEFSITKAWVSATGADGSFTRQAGAHADLRTYIEFTEPTATTLSGNPKTVRVELPPGTLGDPTANPTCPEDLLAGPVHSSCPTDAQVGVASIGLGGNGSFVAPIYNMERPTGVPARFGFDLLNAPVIIDAEVNPGDYRISAISARISQSKPIFSTDVTLWGVPADPRHDPQRFDTNDANFLDGIFNPSWPYNVPSNAARLPFLSLPTSCPGTPGETTISADSWQNPGVFSTVRLTEDVDGTPLTNEGCERLAFDPSIDVQPLSHVADAPTGLVVDLEVPQNEAPDGLSTAHLKRAEVTLPQGMSVSPSAAAGLGACASNQINLGSDAPVTCPDSSRIGTVRIDTPVLDEPVTGDVILAKQDDNPFHSLLALYIVANGPGFTIKLPGRVDPDPVTGQLTATFDDNPQLPFEHLHLAFRGGSQASLATPPTCGTYTTHTELISWASDTPVEIDTPMVIDEGCEPQAFAPSLSAGSVSSLAGADSPFTLTLTRADRTPYLAKIATTLPPGLLARISGATQCPEDRAAAGTCQLGTEIGSTSVLSGPGAAPLALKGRVYLTGPYKGAPFGLSIVVPTAGQAGPFDIGDVVVRAAIFVDRNDGHVSVVSDPLPTIIEGIPLRLRQVGVKIDRPGFTFNPTNCSSLKVIADVQAVGGASASLSVPFAVGGCRALGFAPKLAMTLTGKGQTTDGKHPALKAHLVTNPGDANNRRVQVALPLSLALDPNNAGGLCEPAAAVADTCPAASIVGHARALTPILNQPLTAPVYFVRGVRTDPKSGRTIRTLPKLYVPLKGENGVKIDLHASSQVINDRLVTTFDDIPDAPVSDFTLEIDGGKHGILVVSGTDVCKSTQIADAKLEGQNGGSADQAIAMGTPCSLRVVGARHTARSLKLTVGGLGAGSLAVTGKGLDKTSKTIKRATTTTVAVPLRKSIRTALAHGRKVKLNVAVSFRPKGVKKSRRATQQLVIRGVRGKAALKR